MGTQVHTSLLNQPTANNSSSLRRVVQGRKLTVSEIRDDSCDSDHDVELRLHHYRSLSPPAQGYRSLPTTPLHFATSNSRTQSPIYVNDNSNSTKPTSMISDRYEPFQRSGLRGSNNSVRSDSVVQRKAVSFGAAVRYEFPKNSQQLVKRNTFNGTISPPVMSNGSVKAHGAGHPQGPVGTFQRPSAPVTSTPLLRPASNGRDNRTNQVVVVPSSEQQQQRQRPHSAMAMTSSTKAVVHSWSQPMSPIARPPTIQYGTLKSTTQSMPSPISRQTSLEASENDDVFDSGIPVFGTGNKAKATPGDHRTSGGWSDGEGSQPGNRCAVRPMRRDVRRHTLSGDAVVVAPFQVSASSDSSRMAMADANGTGNSGNSKSSRSKTNKISQDQDPKKGVILGHLQKKFPDYAESIAGRKDQLVMHGSRDGKEWTKVVYSHLYTQRSHSMYQPPSSIYDDDPGIMSEAETSATGFRRGGKQRSSLPVVRTPNKSLERPLGLVFLQYRSETKRALLPNEITSLDTVKALFVRSFPHQLSMEYLESPRLRIYIHDPSKDMFYELEDLRDIRDRSVLRIYEHDVNGGAPQSTWDPDMSYFSEPEFDSEYQHQHIHRSKVSKAPLPSSSSYYGVAHAYSLANVGRTATLPHTGQLRSYSPAPVLNDRAKTQTLPLPGSDIGSRTLPLPGSMQAPPKPQRSYQQPVTSMAKSVRATPPPQGPPPSAPSPRTSQGGTSVPYGTQGYAVLPNDARAHQVLPPPQGTICYQAVVPQERPYASKPSCVGGGPEHGGHDAYPPAQDRRIEHHRSYPMYLTPSASYEDAYYSDRSYGSCSGTVTPVIDEEARRDGFVLARDGLQAVDSLRYRARVEYMERQLASLTGLVHKALTTSRPPPIQRDIEINLNRELLHVPNAREAVAVYKGGQQQQQGGAGGSGGVGGVGSGSAGSGGSSGDICEVKPNVSSSSSPSLSDDYKSDQQHTKPDLKTVPRPLSKEEKSVSFSDDPPNISSPTHSKQHSPQHTAEKPAKPALKTSTLPRSYSSDKERPGAKPTPPPKPFMYGSQEQRSSRDLQISPEMYNQLRLLKKKTKDLRMEVRNLRRMTQAQAMNVKETIRETFIKMKAMMAAVEADNDQMKAERYRVTREEESYRQDITQLEISLSELEGAVEDLRSNVINRRCRVNMSEVENMALVLSKASKTVADLKGRYPSLQEGLKGVMAAEMEVIVREEKFLKDEPDRLDNALRRCKKLTGTLVTLKRLASVQEQRLPPTSPGMEQRATSLPSSASIGDGHFDGLTVGPDGQIAKSSRRAGGWKWSTNFRDNIDPWRAFSANGWSEKAASFSGEVSRQSSVSSDGGVVASGQSRAGSAGSSAASSQKGDSALDDLLDELQINANPLPPSRKSTPEIYAAKRLPSYPSTDSTQASVGPAMIKVPTGSSISQPTSAPVGKLQVTDAVGGRQSVSITNSPAATPTPPPREDAGKVSPRPHPHQLPAIRQTVIEGPVNLVVNKVALVTASASASVAAPAPPPPSHPNPAAGKKLPPPPPPRTSSKSPLVSPTSPMSPSGRPAPPPHLPRATSLQVGPTYTTSRSNSSERGAPAGPDQATNGLLRRKSSAESSSGSSASSSRQSSLESGDGNKDHLCTTAISDENLRRDQLSSNSSSSESVNSQEGLQSKLERNQQQMEANNRKKNATPPTPPTRNRQEILEQRHQELLRRQRQLQEQYAKLQQLQRGQTLQRFSPPRSPADLKKTGSESNILLKAGLAMSTTSGSLTHLAPIGLSSGSTSKSFANQNSVMVTSIPTVPGSTAATVVVVPAVAASTSQPIVPLQQTTNKIYETDIL